MPDLPLPPPQASRAEWLEPDGLGGFASGTQFGPRTRRYHALLLTAVSPPTSRMVLVNGIEAWLDHPSHPALPLTTQCYGPDAILSPAGWQTVTGFEATPWPAWTHTLPDGTVLQFDLFTATGAGATVLRWHLSPSESPPISLWRLHVRPLLSGRDQHALHSQNTAFDFTPTIQAGRVSWRPYATVPATAALTNGTYTHAPQWYTDFLYTQERDRGLDCTEDLASPGIFSFALGPTPAVMILRAGDSLALHAADHAQTLADAERHHRASLHQGAEGQPAGCYLVDRGAGRTVIAGYPWFTDWGRDSFIALRGLAIATGRIADATAILLEWAATVDQGMLPNRFPDSGGAPEFNAVDASLWFIIAVYDVLAAAPPDPAVQATLQAAADAILGGYQAGTRFNIRMDTDGLLAAGQPGVQLTWMDAKVADWVVTPRIGKPVEVQALWINALAIAARWNPHWATIATRAMAAFRTRFINPAGGLYDVVDADHVPGRTDASLRPNQIFAVGGLPVALLDGAEARAVVDLVEAHLLTPLGLRTLAPTDPAYQPHYQGTLLQRDGAYHQGTVWPWLMGPFVEAWLRTHGNTPATRIEAATRFLAPLEAHRATTGLGHITEVADGDAPHTPGGCPFQAWSLGEFIRIRQMLA